MSDTKPEVWGGGCECWVVPEKYWTTHYGAVEPGSQIEYNPECPEHGKPCSECNDRARWGAWDIPDWATPIFCEGCGGLLGVEA